MTRQHRVSISHKEGTPIAASGVTVGDEGYFIRPTLFTGKNMTRQDVMAAFRFVAPAIGIPDTRIQKTAAETGRTHSVFDIISHNAVNAGIVLGIERQTPLTCAGSVR